MSSSDTWGCLISTAFVIFIGAIIFCYKPAPPPLPAPPSSGPWQITLEGEFTDALAYGGTHRIFRMTHTDGTVLVGVTGMGTTEIGEHAVKSGKTTKIEKEER